MAEAVPATRVKLAGELRVYVGGRHVEEALPGRRGRLLFAYLALNRQRPVTRHELVNALWEGELPQSPGAALSTLLSRLRSALGVGVLEGKGELRLYLGDSAWIDVEAGERALRQARSALERDDFKQALRHAGEALDLLGELLPGFDASWISERERELEDLRVEALECIAQAGLVLGGTEVRTAERAARALIERVPYRESGYEALMDAHSRHGNIAEALQVYDLLRTVLRDELGAFPGERLQRLHQRLLMNESPPAGTDKEEDGAAYKRSGVEALPPLPPVLGRASGDLFFGRDPLLAKLHGALEQAGASDSRLLLLAGEAGIGKTRLAAQFARSARSGGATVLYGRSDRETLIGYQPFLEALRHYVLASEPAQLRRVVDPRVGAELSRLLPELRRKLPDLPEPGGGEPETQRYRLFEAVSTFLFELGAAGSLVLVLDDLHWSDPPSLALLRHLVRSPTQARAVIVGTYRPTDLAPGAALSDLLAELRRERVSEELALEGLERDETAALVRSTAGADLPEAFVERLYDDTRGNPFFVGEVMRDLAESGAREGADTGVLKRLSIADIGIPDTVKELIGRRVSNLSTEAQDALRLASVIGQDFDLDTLDRLSDASADRLVELLEEAVAAGLVVEVHEASARYAFQHPLTRASLYEGLSRTRRLRLHRRIAEALAGRAEDSAAGLAELAFHFFASRSLGDAEKAVDYSLRAGRAAMELLAYEEAAAHYRRALEAGEAVPLAEERRCELLLSLGGASLSADDKERARDSFRAAAEVARRLGLADQLGRAATGFAGKGHGATGVCDRDVVELLEEAAAALRGSGNDVEAQVLSRLAIELYWSEAADHRRRLSERAVAIARRTSDEGALAAALNARVWATWSPDNTLERLALSEEAIALADGAGREELALECRTWRYVSRLELDASSASDRELEDYCRRAEEFGQAPYAVYAKAVQTNRATMLGRFEEAARLAAETAALGRRLEDPNTEGIVISKWLWLHRQTGGVSELLPAVEAAAEALPAMPIWRALLALALSDEGELEAAHQHLERLAERDFAGVPRDMFWLMCQASLAEVVVRLGDDRAARTLYGLLEPFAERHVTATGDISLGSASRILGGLAWTFGAFEDAVRHFERGLERNREWGLAPWIAHTQHEYARMLVARAAPGDRAHAYELLAGARRLAKELGMIVLARRVREASASSASA